MQNSAELVICRVFNDAASVIAEIDIECNSPPWSLSVIEGELSNDITWCLAARNEGQILGYCMAHIVAGEAHILTLGVRLNARRRGVGRSLIKRLIETCESHGVQHILLEVRRGNVAAISLYDEFGFFEVGVRRNYYRDNDEDAVVMRREL